MPGAIGAAEVRPHIRWPSSRIPYIVLVSYQVAELKAAKEAARKAEEERKAQAALAAEAERAFGAEAGPKLLAALAAHGVWDFDDLAACRDRDGILLAAAGQGFKVCAWS